jgi:hypothetical protein
MPRIADSAAMRPVRYRCPSPRHICRDEAEQVLRGRRLLTLGPDKKIAAAVPEFAR